MRIALDTLGGDLAPDSIVAGALQAMRADRALRVTFVGDQASLERLIPRERGLDQRTDIYHSSQVVTADEDPIEALRRKPDSSVARCWQLLAEKKVEAIVSAGNTRAIAAAALRLHRFLPNVRRPGVAVVLPTIRGSCVLLDVGVNTEPRPAHLYQYGVMGTAFARLILRKKEPTVGLLNVGGYGPGGPELSRETHTFFRQSPLQPYFVGDIPSIDLFRGAADVVVCDAFVGNLALKVGEGVFDFVIKITEQEVFSALAAERPKAEHAVKALVHRYDYSASGGAPLLGIDGICIVCHGRSDERAIKNAIGVAARCYEGELNALMVRDLEVGPLAGIASDES